MRAPPGFTAPATVALLAFTAEGAPVATSLGAYASANRCCAPIAPSAKRKNGVPSAAASQVLPSACVGLVVQVDETGGRRSTVPARAMPVGVSSLKTGAAAPPSKGPL